MLDCEKGVKKVLRIVLKPVCPLVSSQVITACVHAFGSGQMSDEAPRVAGTGGSLPSGISELMCTAAFLRAFTAAGSFKRPPRVGHGTWSAYQPGVFGPPWDEDTRPAAQMSDLHDYITGAPADNAPVFILCAYRNGPRTPKCLMPR
jgi:hypothetical protein